MMRTLRIAALQLDAHDRDALPERRDRIFRLAAQAAESSDLVVLPEATFPAYILGDDRIDDDAVISALDTLGAIARQASCTIVTGAALRRDGRLFNCAVAIDRDGSIAGMADKAFLWHFDRKWFAPAQALAPVRTSAGNLGLFVCADGRMPGVARELIDLGAEVLVMPTAWVTSGRDPANLENIQADFLARVRAFENGVPLAAANKSGVERAMVAYCGKSQIVGADGTVAAIADTVSEEILRATVSLGSAQPFRCDPIHVPRCDAPALRAIRVAISIDAPPDDIGERIDELDAEVALAPGDAGLERLRSLVPTISIDAMRAFDPGCLIEARLAGIRVAILDAVQSHAWLERIARARALELRMYAIVFDRQANRAYAIDPDGAVVAGTFGDYRLASFTLDARRTSETLVAPGTDVAEGLERIDRMRARRTRA